MKKQAALPAKDKGTFNSIVKLYEQKHYRKAVKLADNLLKRHTNHGETLAMKGLAMHEMGKKEEAMELVKLGIRNDMRSHVTWHVLGLIHRSNRDYREAVKCYRQALRIDPDNLNILRDASLLQIQMRDHRGFMESRRRLLTLKSNLKTNWIGFAVAHHLNQNYDMVMHVLKMYEGTLAADKTKKHARDYDSNEVALYGCNVLEEAGKLQEALEYLDSKRDKVLDSGTFTERRGQLLVRLNRAEEAVPLFKSLIERNPENYAYHRGYQCALLDMPQHLFLKACGTPGTAQELNAEQVELLSGEYAAFRAAQPRCRAHRRIPLDFLPASDPRFRAALDTVLRRDLRKGMPSLFMHLKSLYSQPGKAEVIGELVEGYLEALATGRRLPVAEGASPDTAPEEPEDPTLVIWVKMFSGQHFDKMGMHVRALRVLDEAILYTPTVLDLYMWRGRVLKHAGQLKAAAESYNQGRLLDLADRYISSKTAKYQLRAGMEEEGEVTANLFSRDTRSVTDMQCMWFEVEAGNCHLNKQHYGKALQKFMLVEAHFKDYKHNQFDFHTYCLRKMTLRSYLTCMDVIDHMPEHERYQQAIQGIVKTYLLLADRKVEADAKKAEADAEAARVAATTKPLTAKQRKAKKNAERRARRKAQKLEEEAAAAAAAAGGSAAAAPAAATGDKDESKLEDEAAKLEAVEQPLEEAAKYARKLGETGKHDVTSQLLVFEVALRRGKLLQALRALRRAAAAAPEFSPDVFSAKVRFLVSAQGEAGTAATEAVQAVLAEELPAADLLPSGTVPQLVGAFAEAHKLSLPHRTAAAEMMVFVDASTTARAVELLSDTTGSGVTLSACVAANAVLVKLGATEAAAAHTEKCRELFPLATAFGADVLGTARYGSLVDDGEDGAVSSTPAADLGPSA